MAPRLGRDWGTIIERAADLVEAETERVGVPPTLRRVHYLLLGDEAALAAKYSNTEGAYNYLSAKTAPMRDERTFPPLVGRTRSLAWLEPSESDPATILRQAARRHRSARWTEQPVGVVLVVEKDGLVPAVEQWFLDLGVPITALRGHTSQSHVADVRWVVDELKHEHERVVVLYAGDYDPSGLHIPQDFTRRLDRSRVRVMRVALDREQVTRYRLPIAPAKQDDTRRAAMIEAEGEAMQVELDALDPLVLRGLFTAAIDQLGKPDTWWRQITRERLERQAIRAAADQLGGAA